MKSIEQWQKTKDLIQAMAQDCKQSFQEQIQKVKEGTVLATLPKLELPRAPPPPDPLPPQMVRTTSSSHSYHLCGPLAKIPLHTLRVLHRRFGRARPPDLVVPRPT
jgi:hypothetical protein